MVDASSKAIPFAFTTALALTLMVVVTSNIRENVQWPTDQLLSDHCNRRDDRGLFHQFRELVRIVPHSGGILISSFRNKDHIALDVAGSLVVLAMGNLPGEIRNQQSRMAEPPDRVIERLGWREGLMSALVGQDPKTGTEKTLDKGVYSPQGCTA